jgi:hypothetical protein
MTTHEKGLIVLAVVAGIPWFCCLVHLWIRRGASLRRRLIWSVILSLPILGPLLYGSLFVPLDPHSPGTRPVRGQGGISYPSHPGSGS